MFGNPNPEEDRVDVPSPDSPLVDVDGVKD
jgi:hypothetical protein